jgi:hypothetical protein
MTEYMGITCRSTTGCNDNANTLLIYGCWDGHLAEYALCGPCARIWVSINQDGRVFCNCGLRIGDQLGTDFEILRLDQTTQKYRIAYIHGTVTPNTRHPYAPEPQKKKQYP